MIKKGDTLVVWHPDRSILIEVDGEVKKIKGLGVVDTSKLIGSDYGEKVRYGRNEYVLLQPAVKDISDFLKRRAQVILPRIGAQILLHADISCGDRVVEGGAGSGFLSAVLCQAVGPEGKVYTYELREEHLKVAKKNIERLGFGDRWSSVLGDVTSDVKQTDIDAFIVDIPEPWEALDMAELSLKNGGFFVSYIPTTNQLERIYTEMENEGFVDIKAFENLEREIKVKEGAVRPSFDMLGHTGYVVVGRKTVQ
ncbi:MAG: tRNA (adenine-N1)-methyltransferase [Thermoplasmata archaeon]